MDNVSAEHIEQRIGGNLSASIRRISNFLEPLFALFCYLVFKDLCHMHNLLFVEGMGNRFTFCFPNLVSGTKQECITHEVRKK